MPLLSMYRLLNLEKRRRSMAAWSETSERRETASFMNLVVLWLTAFALCFVVWRGLVGKVYSFAFWAGQLRKTVCQVFGCLWHCHE